MTQNMTNEQSAALLAQELLGQFIQHKRPFMTVVREEAVYVNEHTSLLGLTNIIETIFENSAPFVLSDEQKTAVKAKMTGILEDLFTLTLLEIQSNEDLNMSMEYFDELHNEILDELDEIQNGEATDGLEDFLPGWATMDAIGEKHPFMHAAPPFPFGFGFGTVSSEDGELEKKAKEVFTSTLNDITSGKLHPFEAQNLLLSKLQELGENLEIKFF